MRTFPTLHLTASTEQLATGSSTRSQTRDYVKGAMSRGRAIGIGGGITTLNALLLAAQRLSSPLGAVAALVVIVLAGLPAALWWWGCVARAAGSMFDSWDEVHDRGIGSWREFFGRLVRGLVVPLIMRIEGRRRGSQE